MHVQPKYVCAFSVMLKWLILHGFEWNTAAHLMGQGIYRKWDGKGN